MQMKLSLFNISFSVLYCVLGAFNHFVDAFVVSFTSSSSSFCFAHSTGSAYIWSLDLFVYYGCVITFYHNFMKYMCLLLLECPFEYSYGWNNILNLWYCRVLQYHVAKLDCLRFLMLNSNNLLIRNTIKVGDFVWRKIQSLTTFENLTKSF